MVLHVNNQKNKKNWKSVDRSVDEFTYGHIELEVPVRHNRLIHLFIHSTNIYRVSTICQALCYVLGIEQ